MNNHMSSRRRQHFSRQRATIPIIGEHCGLTTQDTCKCNNNLDSLFCKIYYDKKTSSILKSLLEQIIFDKIVPHHPILDQIAKNDFLNIENNVTTTEDKGITSIGGLKQWLKKKITVNLNDLIKWLGYLTIVLPYIDEVFLNTVNSASDLLKQLKPKIIKMKTQISEKRLEYNLVFVLIEDVLKITHMIDVIKKRILDCKDCGYIARGTLFTLKNTLKLFKIDLFQRYNELKLHVRTALTDTYGFSLHFLDDDPKEVVCKMLDQLQTNECEMCNDLYCLGKNGLKELMKQFDLEKEVPKKIGRAHV